jgi:hypothetical protein
MPTYAESKLAPEHHGFPIFYELLPLDIALAEETSAIESDRDALGEQFDAYRTSQVDTGGVHLHISEIPKLGIRRIYPAP